MVLGLPGGGWAWVDPNSLAVTLSTLTADGYAVAVADYAFASSTIGTHIWPANFEDVQNAVRWIRGNASRFDFDPTKIAVWGESAGGHLADLLGTDPSGHKPQGTIRQSPGECRSRSRLLRTDGPDRTLR